jgi:hypothetical protein
MKRATLIYGLLLVLAAGGSWIQWTTDAPVDLEGRVAVLTGSAKAITAVRWVGEDTEATIVQKSDERGGYFWVDYTRYKKTDKPVDVSTDDTGEAPPEMERVAIKTAFKSAGKSDALMASFSPLAARRQLTITDEAKLEELGLDQPTARIEIDRAGHTEVLEIGAEAYGSRDYYVRHVSTGAIYLFERDLVQPLKYARTRLPDRSLYGVARADIDSATLTVEGASKVWNQMYADDKAKAHWVLGDGLDQEAERATTWLDKFLKLKGTQFADPNAPPADLQPRFSVRLSQGDSQTTVAVSQVGAQGDWYAQSEHTRGLIKLVRSGAGALNEDAAALVSLGD